MLLALTAAAASACTPNTPTVSPELLGAAEPAVVTVRLDVTGTGTGNIRFSSDRGVMLTTGAVLHGWTHSYTATSDAPIVLEVRHRADTTAECAVHVDSQLRASASGVNPVCTVVRS